MVSRVRTVAFQGIEALPVDVQGTAFQEAVWQALRTIPAGETRNFGFQFLHECGHVIFSCLSLDNWSIFHPSLKASQTLPPRVDSPPRPRYLSPDLNGAVAKW